MKTLLREAAGYAAASLTALLVDVGLLWMLVSVAGCPYLIAATLSFLTGAWVAYALAVRIAFTRHRLSDRRVEFVVFLGLGAIGLAVNVTVLYVLVDRLGVHYLAAKGAAAGGTFTSNFILRRQILFTRRLTGP